MTDSHSRWLFPLLLIGVIAGGAWYFWTQSRSIPADPVAATNVPAQNAAKPAASGPANPLRDSPAGDAQRTDLTPLPALSESDEYFKLDMASLFGGGITELLADTALIEKIVATVDNLPREHLAERIRPINAVAGPFLADGQDGSGQYTVNPANYGRYDFIVNLLATADVEAAVEVYRRFYPLFQAAYADLGYPQGYFNDRVVEVIDHLLATPDIQAPVDLVRPHVLYEFADPDIEGLSIGQKMLLRIGDSHAVRVKQFLEELRVHIAAPAT